MAEYRDLGDRYEVREEIGEGAAATVFLAHDRRLNRPVALKVLKPERGRDPEYVARFQREASAAAGLNHPHVVTIFDYGRSDGTHYIAMEHVAGGNLQHLLARERRLSPARAVALTKQILAALGAAHAAGIVHRDVKPSNVLITAGGQVKVADFGIALSGDPALTGMGLVPGTALYLSPEQATGRPATPDSDIYAAGVVLFEMLVGRPPFLGQSAVEVALRHVNDEPPHPSSLEPAIPPRLEGIVLRALAKNPARRWESAEAFARALEEYETAALLATGAIAPVVAAAVPERASVRRDVGSRRPPPAPQPRRAGRWTGAVMLLGIAALFGACALATAEYLPRAVSGALAPSERITPTLPALHVVQPTSTPTVTPTPTLTVTPRPGTTHTPAPTATATPTPAPEATATPSPAEPGPSPTPEVTPPSSEPATPGPSPTPEGTPTPDGAATPTPVPPSAEPTPTAGQTPGVPTATPAATQAPVITATPPPVEADGDDDDDV